MEQNCITLEFQRQCNVGYWWMDKVSNLMYISEYICELLEIDNNQLSYIDFLEFIPISFRNNCREQLNMITSKQSVDLTCPLEINGKQKWIKFIRTVENEDNNKSWGTIHHISTPVSLQPSHTHLSTTPELMTKMQSFIHAINEMMDSSDLRTSINVVLQEIIDQLHIDRCYLFLFDQNRKEHKCIALVSKRKIYESDILYKKFPNSVFHSLIKRLLSGKSNIIEDVQTSTLINEFERNLLSEYAMGATIETPLQHKKQVLGFIGIDMVNRSYTWNTKTITWFTHLVNLFTPFLQLKLRSLNHDQSSENEQETKNKTPLQNYTTILATFMLNSKGYIIQECCNDSRYQIQNRDITLFHPAFLDLNSIDSLLDQKITTLTLNISWRQLDQFISIIGPFIPSQFKVNIKRLSQLNSTDCYYYCTLSTYHYNEPMIYETHYRELCHQISQFAGIGILQYNPLTHEANANQQWLLNTNCIGLKWKDCITKIQNTIHSEDYEIWSHRLRQLRSGEINETLLEYRLIERNQWKWIREYVYCLPSSESSQTIMITNINLNVTREKQLEQRLIRMEKKAAESDQMKSTFIANISHELRTPLNAIIGLSDILNEAESNKERDEYIAIIKKNNQQLLNLFDDIIQVSHIETEKFALKPEQFDFNNLCHQIIEKISYQLNDDTTFDFIPEKESLPLFHDKDKLTIIISNLITNASKFTQKGTITIRYRLFSNVFRFTVEDTGIGIAPTQMKTIFNRFVKVSSFTPGNGLGLFICKQLIKKMGGDIGVHSKLGKGSKFWFKIPLLNIN